MLEASDVRGSPKKLSRRPRRTYRNFSDDDRRAALDLAAEIGVRPACRELDIAATEFYRWVKAMPEYWSDLQRARAPRLDDLVDRYAAAEDKAIDQAELLIASADAKETAALIKAMGAARGLAHVGARQTRGEADTTHDLNINFPQIEAAAEAVLQRAKPTKAIEGTAEDDD